MTKPKGKIWEEVISETPELKTIAVHDDIEGKICPNCSKKLNPDKIFWLRDRFLYTATDPTTNQIVEQTTIYLVQYGMCSKKCRNAYEIILKKTSAETREALKKQFGNKATII